MTINLDMYAEDMDELISPLERVIRTWFQNTSKSPATPTPKRSKRHQHELSYL